jgi:hypothetical protein
MNWIAAHSPAAIALIVFALCYSVGALIFGILRVLSKYRVARDLEAITPAMVTPIGVIGGLLIAFLAARVWSNLDRANSYVGQEANAIRELNQLAGEMPSTVREAVRRGAHTYVSWVTLQDWPQMVAGRGASEPRPPGLLDALTSIAAYNPGEAGQRAVQQSALASLERALGKTESPAAQQAGHRREPMGSRVGVICLQYASRGLCSHAAANCKGGGNVALRVDFRIMYCAAVDQ